MPSPSAALYHTDSSGPEDSQHLMLPELPPWPEFTTSAIVVAGTDRSLVLVAKVKQRSVSSKAAPLGFGPSNSAKRSLPTAMPPVFQESRVGELCTLLETKHTLLDLGQGTRFSLCSPEDSPSPYHSWVLWS